MNNQEIKMPNDVKNGPCCGVAASAMASGKSFNEVWNMISKFGNKEENWDGTTKTKEILFPIIANGNMFQDIDFINMIDLIFNRKIKNWIKRRTKKNVMYLILTEDEEEAHAQIVYNNTVFDQCFREGVYIDNYDKRNMKIFLIFKITRYNY